MLEVPAWRTGRSACRNDRASPPQSRRHARQVVLANCAVVIVTGGSSVRSTRCHTEPSCWLQSIRCLHAPSGVMPIRQHRACGIAGSPRQAGYNSGLGMAVCRAVLYDGRPAIEERWMHFASITVRGRASFGVVVGNGVGEIRPSFRPLPDPVDVLRAGASDEVAAALSAFAPIFRSTRSSCSPRFRAAENPLHRRELRQSRRRADLRRGNEDAKFEQFFKRERVVGQMRRCCGRRSRATDTRARSRGDRQDRAARCPMSRREPVAVITPRQRRHTIRDWIKHGLSTSRGQELGRQRQHRPRG